MDGQQIYDLLDTALKIGLGALIGGIFAILTVWAKGRTGRKQQLRVRRRELLEDIVEDLEGLIEPMVETASTLMAVLKADKDVDEEAFNQVIEEFDDMRFEQDNVSEYIRIVSRSYARLMLLGLNECSDLAVQYCEAISVVHDHWDGDGPLPDL